MKCSYKNTMSCERGPKIRERQFWVIFLSWRVRKSHTKQAKLIISGNGRTHTENALAMYDCVLGDNINDQKFLDGSPNYLGLFTN